MTEFAVGDRVTYIEDAGDALNGHWIAGEIVEITHRLALIRPDNRAESGIMITTRHTRDIRKENDSGQSNAC